MNLLDNLKAILKPSVKMPVLFVGHGNPMNAIEKNSFVQGFKEVAQVLPTPQAILCVSAHWYTSGTLVTAMKDPKTIHDFHGFPEILYKEQYPAPGFPELASVTKEILAPEPIELNHGWGFDHGTWTILKHMYPSANIPVIQLSIDRTKPANYHYSLATQLSRLRDFGVLIIGSGNIVHNLRMVDFAKVNKENYGYDWAIEAREILNTLILDGDTDSLCRYDKLGQAVRLAVPTAEHYLPLLYAMALKNPSDSIDLFNDRLLAGSLSMTSVIIGQP